MLDGTAESGSEIGRRDEPRTGRSSQGSGASQPSSVGIAAVALGVAGVVMPYFAQVFLVPAAFVFGLTAYRRGETKYGRWALILSAVGFLAILNTSAQITSIQSELQRQLNSFP